MALVPGTLLSIRDLQTLTTQAVQRYLIKGQEMKAFDCWHRYKRVLSQGVSVESL